MMLIIVCVAGWIKQTIFVSEPQDGAHMFARSRDEGVFVHGQRCQDGFH